MTILAAHRWPTNADLIADMAELGYLHADALTLDPTYGRGNWWKKWRPDHLVAHDLRTDGTDFRDLPYGDGHFGQAVFDPPYMAPGGRRTSTIGNFNDRFGLHELPATPRGAQDLIDDGLTEVVRVTRPRSIVLVKCMDYINGGAFTPGTHWTLTHALGLGCELVDRIEHVRRPGPQPPRPRQLHSRRNLSTLFVLRTPRRAGRRLPGIGS